MMTCRCPICHRNDAGSNRKRKSYVSVGIKKDEHGHTEGGISKQKSRRLRRTREKRNWQKED